MIPDHIQEMETRINFPDFLSAELAVRTMWEALGLSTFLLAEKCILWFLLETGCLPVHVFQGCLIDKSLPLCLFVKQDRNEQDVGDYDGMPNDDAGTVRDDDIFKEGDNADYGNGIEDHNMSGGEGSDDSDQEFEDRSGSYSDGGSDDDGDEDEDDVDDDIDMEDYDDDDEEEESDEEDEDNSIEDEKGSSEDSTEKNHHFPQLKNAKNVYTSEDTFRLFEHERKKTRTLDIDVKSDMDLSDRGLEITYEVGKSWQFERRYTVTVLPMDGIVECSCKYFESSGVLCSHSQVALKCLRIDKIPDRYRLQDKNMAPGLAEGVHPLIKNQEEFGQSSPHCTEFNRPAGPGDDIISGSQADEEIRTDYTDPPLLRHAKDVYSSDMFNMFQEEYKKSEYLIAREVNTIIEGGLVVHYVVEETGNYSYFSIPRHSVRAVPKDGTVNCSCKKFEKTELLCCHAIVVLDYLCIVKIPGQYILDKFKKDETVSTVQEIHGPEYPNLKSFLIYKTLKNKFDELFGMPINTEEDARLLDARLDKLDELLKGMKRKQESEEVGGDSLLASGESTSATTQELTEKENTGSHNDVHAQMCRTSPVIEKVDQSTIINGVPRSSSPPTNFGTQDDGADN